MVDTQVPPDTRSSYAQGKALQALASSTSGATVASRKNKTPLDITTVRRSARTNKYDGFKVCQVNDNMQTKSRVKPQVMPCIKIASTAADPVSDVAAPPPPTSIEEIQSLGARCGVPPEEITEDKLLDGQQSVAPPSPSHLGDE